PGGPPRRLGIATPTAESRPMTSCRARTSTTAALPKAPSECCELSGWMAASADGFRQPAVGESAGPRTLLVPLDLGVWHHCRDVGSVDQYGACAGRMNARLTIFPSRSL